MKKKIKYVLVILMWGMCVTTVGAHTQHWTCNPYDWQYDMALYFTVSINNMHISDLSGYEVAAFCGEECRGVATVNTVEKEGATFSYGYLRIRSNQTLGEKITFKMYDYVKGEEMLIEDTMEFVSNGVEGLPSNPIVMRCVSYLRGDTNGDGNVNMDDATFVTDIILGKEDATEAADVNGDGVVNMPDVMFIINNILNGKFPDE